MTVVWQPQGARATDQLTAASQVLNNPQFASRTSYTLCKNSRSVHCPDESGLRVLESEVNKVLRNERRERPQKKKRGS